MTKTIIWIDSNDPAMLKRFSAGSSVFSMHSIPPQNGAEKPTLLSVGTLSIIMTG